MGAIVDLIRSFWRLFIWWVVILPWEEAVRVRLGRHRARLLPGLHFRIPYIDSVFKQSNRERWSTLTPQTVTTNDGHTLTLAGQLGYCITNVEVLYDTLQHAEAGVRSMAQGAIAEFVHRHRMVDCSPDNVAVGAAASLNLDSYGLEVVRLQLTTFCRVKTYRFIMDSHENIWEDLLNTSVDDKPKAA